MSRFERWRRVVRGVAPYVVSIAVVGWILRKYDLRSIGEQLHLGRASAMLPISVALPFVILGLVSAWDTAVFRSVAPGIAYWDVLRGKAGSSVLQVFGYGAGQGAYGIWLVRLTGGKPSQVAGALLYVVVSDLGALAAVASTAMLLSDLDVPWAFRTGVYLVAAAPMCLIAGGASLPKRSVFYPWRTIARTTGLSQWAGRCFNIALHVLGFWLAARAFGLPIPFRAAACYVPVLLLVTALPVNVGGFGAVQLLWLRFFREWSPEPAILAFHFLLMLGLTAGTVLRGLPFLRRVVTEVDRGHVQLTTRSEPRTTP